MSPYALKGQKLLAQGIALGFCGSQNNAPCKGKSFKNPDNLQSFCPFRASWVISIIQEGVLGESFALG